MPNTEENQSQQSHQPLKMKPLLSSSRSAQRTASRAKTFFALADVTLYLSLVVAFILAIFHPKLFPLAVCIAIVGLIIFASLRAISTRQMHKLAASHIHDTSTKASPGVSQPSPSASRPQIQPKDDDSMPFTEKNQTKRIQQPLKLKTPPSSISSDPPQAFRSAYLDAPRAKSFSTFAYIVMCLSLIGAFILISSLNMIGILLGVGVVLSGYLVFLSCLAVSDHLQCALTSSLYLRDIRDASNAHSTQLATIARDLEQCRHALSRIDDITSEILTRASRPVSSAGSPRNQTKDGVPMSSISVPASIDNCKMKYHYDRVRIFTPKELAPSLASFNPGDRVSFVPEPTNPKDANAVSVVHPAGSCGYLYRGSMQEMVNDYIRKEWPIYSHIDSIDDDAHEITLFIAFYAPSAPSAPVSKTFRLAGTSGQAAQDTIMLLHPDDELEVEYDDEKEKYIVYSMGDPIGYLPKAAEEYADDHTCYVDEISEDSSYVVRVRFE